MHRAPSPPPAHPRARWRVAALLLACLAPLGSAGAAPAGFCDPSLPSPANDPLGYRARGDRCEGRFIKEVGNTTLSLRSLVESAAPLTGAGRRPLHADWPVPPGAGDVALRVQGVKRRLYYRMDTRRPATAGGYAWPSDVLLAVTPAIDDVGLLATTSLPVAGVAHDVYLPLRVGASPQPGQAYTLVVMPGVALSEVFVTADELAPDGGVGRNVLRDAPLQYGYYPAERGIEIRLPLASLGAGGLVRVRLVAKIEAGGSATLDAWLYHPRTWK